MIDSGGLRAVLSHKLSEQHQLFSDIPFHPCHAMVELRRAVVLIHAEDTVPQRKLFCHRVFVAVMMVSVFVFLYGFIVATVNPEHVMATQREAAMARCSCTSGGRALLVMMVSGRPSVVEYFGTIPGPHTPVAIVTAVVATTIVVFQWAVIRVGTPVAAGTRGAQVRKILHLRTQILRPDVVVLL